LSCNLNFFFLGGRGNQTNFFLGEGHKKFCGGQFFLGGEGGEKCEVVKFNLIQFYLI